MAERGKKGEKGERKYGIRKVEWKGGREKKRQWELKYL